MASLTISDWIQLGLLLTQTGIFLFALVGAIIAFLQFHRVIVDIDARQKVIDDVADQWKQTINDVEKKTRETELKNRFGLMGLIGIIILLLILGKNND